MAVPSRIEAARVLRTLHPPAWFVAHSSAVAEVASFLATRMAERGIAIDVPLVEAAALLHDVDKLLPDDDPLRALGHGDAGAAWLSEHGHHELGAAVAHHPATLLGDEERYPRWAATSTGEERVVAYADKRATQDLVPLAERFREWEERHPEHAESLRLARGRAEQLEQVVCTEADVEPDEVGRRPWVDDALQAAG